MNLAGTQSKNLFKSLRVGSPPTVVGLWAAATVVEQIRKDRRPKKERLLKKKLKPGQSYLIRVPGPEDGSLAQAVAPDTVIADMGGQDESVGSQLLGAASGLLEAATSQPADSDDLSGGDSFTSTLVEVAASFMKNGEGKQAKEVPVEVGRRRRTREARLATLDVAEIDREALPRRRRRKLKRAERRAGRRPTRRRVRRARRQQKKSLRAIARAERRSRPSKRHLRKVTAAERELEYRQEKLAVKSTRRRRRKAGKAEKELARLDA
jgi:hypothetical protein